MQPLAHRGMPAIFGSRSLAVRASEMEDPYVPSARLPALLYEPLVFMDGAVAEGGGKEVKRANGGSRRWGHEYRMSAVGD